MNGPVPRRRSWRVPAIAAAAGLAAFLASRALMARPALAEAIYASRLGPYLSRPVSLLTGVLPVALWEVLLAGYATWLVTHTARGVLAGTRRRRTWRDLAAGGLRRAVRDLGVVVFLFYFLWGFNYARPALEDRLGWQAWDGVATAELIELSEAAIAAGNAAYLDLHGVDDAGTATRVEDWRSLERAMDEGWTATARLLDLPPVIGARYGRVKRPLVSEALARLGISGIYFPFTAEANVVADLPAIAVPATMGHEKAHQRGVASEAEASFLGYVAGVTAPDPLARYSAIMFAQRQILAALAPSAPDELRRIAGGRLPGVRRDLVDLAAYGNRYRGVSRTVGTAVNDRYLRANRVPGGVRNYGHATRLMITWARRTGSLLPHGGS